MKGRIREAQRVPPFSFQLIICSYYHKVQTKHLTPSFPGYTRQVNAPCKHLLPGQFVVCHMLHHMFSNHQRNIEPSDQLGSNFLKFHTVIRRPLLSLSQRITSIHSSTGLSHLLLLIVHSVALCL